MIAANHMSGRRGTQTFKGILGKHTKSEREWRRIRRSWPRADLLAEFGAWSGEQLLLYSHLASEISPGKKITTRFLVLTKTKETVIEEHVREVHPAAVNRTLAGVERVWRGIESGVDGRGHGKSGMGKPEPLFPRCQPTRFRIIAIEPTATTPTPNIPSTLGSGTAAMPDAPAGVL